jgi:AP endonuclease-2
MVRTSPSKKQCALSPGTKAAAAEAGIAKTKLGGSKGVKRRMKLPEPPAAKRTHGQKSLFSFSSTSSSQTNIPEIRPATVQDTTIQDTTVQDVTTQPHKELSGVWKNVFGGGLKAKAPLCSGHNEACVLRKVKKQGPNKDKQFWVCARPMGSKGDPQARCDFFKWVKEKRK